MNSKISRETRTAFEVAVIPSRLGLILCGALCLLGCTEKANEAQPVPVASEATQGAPQNSPPLAQEQSSEEEVDIAFSPPDPGSSEFLDLFISEGRTNPSQERSSGDVLSLADLLSGPETPDYLPYQHMEQTKIRWKQTSGPTMQIRDAETIGAAVDLPEVKEPTRATFAVEMSNPGGKRQGEVTVEIQPKS